jgi:hypothetical protein
MFTLTERIRDRLTDVALGARCYSQKRGTHTECLRAGMGTRGVTDVLRPFRAISRAIVSRGVDDGRLVLVRVLSRL